MVWKRACYIGKFSVASNAAELSHNTISWRKNQNGKFSSLGFFSFFDEVGIRISLWHSFKAVLFC